MSAVLPQDPFAGVRRRVLMIAACPFPAPRGTPVRILRIAESLAARGHEVHLATYHLGTSGGSLPFAVHRVPRVPTYRRMEPGPDYQKLAVMDPLLAGLTLRLARKLRPDILHAHHYEGLLCALPAKLALDVPMVFDSHVLLQAELPYYDLKGLGRAKGRIGAFLDRHLSRRADHVIVVTDDMRRRLLRDGVIPEERLTVAGNGVEEAFFQGRRGVFPQDGRQRLLFTGNLALYQGVDHMVKALALLLRGGCALRLVVATGSDREAFERLARDAGVLQSIDFIDPTVAQLPDVIASADVALNPRTHCPGIPQKLLNYMGAGAAVVSFAGSAKHLRDGENALVVRDGDVEGFARAVARLLDDAALRQVLGERAQLHARENFSWQACVRTVEQVYEHVLARNPLQRHHDGRQRAAPDGLRP
jgi:glycosyltransferase involved in cell wall biosynthesis